MAGAGAGAHQFDVPGLEVELSPLVDVPAGQPRVVDGQGSHPHLGLEVVLDVGPRVSEVSVRKYLEVWLISHLICVTE